MLWVVRNTGGCPPCGDALQWLQPTLLISAVGIQGSDLSHQWLPLFIHQCFGELVPGEIATSGVEDVARDRVT